ncbi:rnase3 domain containing protein [Grosmannia clavigera kw1407]|uniref:Rnase3 domain containing protein n=1 Tax=Grosmannia clavigera (strain kw1407 / UAMH 11150) TaxID=655863 RepID=F0XHZ0_GROCL|nr:rnase3 domain containing protein [Grosmannia clavigera kw1407]EFX03018.1 rnase3 domain containing protein [Grosmannia clavigera kw1407]
MEPDMSMLSSEPPVGESMRLLSSLVLDNTNDEAARDEPLREDVYDDHLEDSDEDGMPLENTGSSNNLNLSQKHRSDKDAFESWLAQNRVSITDSRADETVLRDEDKTTASLVREFEASKIIESPRDYQVELFEKAKQKNVIAVLDTGSGKTLIAALLLRHMIDKELEDRSQGKPARLSFFLVDKVALVFQQHAVLECNLSHSVAKFSGDKVDLRWTSKSFWDDVLRDNMAIVCTADILLKCLHHSYVCMEQINLLIFDEAHHTKKNHAYARIIKDFYAHECPSNRPKIFGMTASPVDARTNIAQAAEELEALLHSEIATVSNDLLLHSVAKPKKEWVLHYHVSLRPPLTELTEKLGRLVGDHRLFAKNFHFARDGLIYLGPWLVDRFWQLIFRAEELAKQEAKAEIDSLPYSTALGRLSGAREIDTSEPALPKGLGQESATNSTIVAAVREASRLVQEYAFIMPSKQMLSNKVRRLHETLSDEYSKLDGRKTRCIVFVDQSLAAYTLKLFDDVFSKWYKGTAADFPYLIAPCSVTRHGFILDEKAPTRSILDWAGINAVSQATDNPYTGNEPDAFFTNKFVSDPFDGSRKFYMRHVRRDLKPLDPVPEGVPHPKHRMWNRNGTKHDILNYSVSLWSKARSKMSIKENQPVVEAEIITNRRNLLDDRVHLDNPEQKICFLVLETLKISPLPAEIVAMAFNIPVIIHRIESTLIALEATSVIGIPRIRPELALEAVTKDCDNPDAQDETPLNFQAGMGRNYERLELLGDSFLKLATSIALFTLVPDKDEFEYHVQRMCMICNRNLFNNALDMKLEEYIRSREFDRTWYPPTIEEAGKSTDNDNYSDNTPAPPSQNGLVLQKGKRTQLPTHHPLGDKTIADVCEAMIGAAYLTTYEERNFDLAVQAVSAVVKSKLHPMQSYAEYYTAYKPPGWQLCPSTAAQLHMAVSIAKDLGYQFRFPRLLRSAFTHPSYPRIYENLPSYQRLEFLGDALLDMAIVDYLFHKFSNKDPQWLTEHKMAMVSNQFLAFLSVSLGFHRHILSFSGEMRKQILEYVTKVEEERVRAESEAVEAGRPASEFARDYWVHVTHPPKALADVLEAYVGALFVDSEYDYHGTVLKFFNTHVQPYFKDMSLYDTFANKHPVTFAVKMLSQRFGCRDWRVIVQEIPDTEGEGCVTFATKVAAGFLVHGQVVGHGIAESGRYAKIGAAKKALAKFSTLSISAFQTLTGCQCSSEPEAVIETDEELSTAI